MSRDAQCCTTNLTSGIELNSAPAVSLKMNPAMKVHACYILGILLAIIVVLLTVEWGAIPTLVAYISFALTATSLLLAILAIAYSIYSNTYLSSTLAQFSSSSGALSASVFQLEAVSGALATKVDAIPASIEGVTRRVEDAHTLLKGLADRATDSSAVAGGKSLATPLKPPTSFLSSASNTGLFALYAAALAHAKGVGFDLQKVAQAVPLIGHEYAYGYLMATDAIGFIDVSLSHNVWTVKIPDPEFVTAINKAVDARIAQKRDDVKKRLEENKEALEAYFAK